MPVNYLEKTIDVFGDRSLGTAMYCGLISTVRSAARHNPGYLRATVEVAIKGTSQDRPRHRALLARLPQPSLADWMEADQTYRDCVRDHNANKAYRTRVAKMWLDLLRSEVRNLPVQ